jgi:hypothetical protein
MGLARHRRGHTLCTQCTAAGMPPAEQARCRRKLLLLLDFLCHLLAQRVMMMMMMMLDFLGWAASAAQRHVSVMCEIRCYTLNIVHLRSHRKAHWPSA